MDANELKDILERGLESPFWAWFSRRVTEEWGPSGAQYQAQMAKALNLTDDHAAASQARQVMSGQKAIMALLAIPRDELRKLKTDAEEPTEERRRPLEPALAGQSRRGAGL